MYIRHSKHFQCIFLKFDPVLDLGMYIQVHSELLAYVIFSHWIDNN